MANIRPISTALLKKAQNELNEIESRIPDDINTLREWLQKERHLITPSDDQFLITFLRGSKYSLQRAKEKIEHFFTIRQAMPEIFTNRDPLIPRNWEIFQTGTGILLPNPLNEDGPVLMLVRPSKYDPSKFNFKEVIKISSIIGDLCMLDSDNWAIAGSITILDLANVTKDHFFQFDLSVMKKLTLLAQEGQPVRQKGIHYLNVPSGFETIFNVLKGFMNEKNKERIFVHSTLQTLYNHIPKQCLPTEYGGDAGSLDDIQKYWEKKLIDSRDQILEWENYGTNENLRTTKSSKLMDEFYGAEGSFRKLTVD